MFAQVTFNGNSRPYTYIVPASMKVEVGDIVSAPVRYGNHLKARVISISENPFHGARLDEMKCIEEIVRRKDGSVECETAAPAREVEVPCAELAEAAKALLSTMERYITDADKVRILREKARFDEEIRTLLAAYDILARC